MKTKYYKALIKITVHDENEYDIDEISSNYEEWLSDTLIDDTYWSGNEIEAELIDWKKARCPNTKSK